VIVLENLLKMSNENQIAEGVEVKETAKEPEFTSDEKAEKVVPQQKFTNTVTDKAQAKLNKLEDQFISLSSQRQLNFILGSLILLAAFTSSLGMLISIILGTFMVVQAVTGNMIMNEFFDQMDQKHKRWMIPALIGITVAIIIAYLVMGLTADRGA
jgi:uncharacterized membrane protein YeaQ/YmgE (transglycosylase-associated protein family)